MARFKKLDGEKVTVEIHKLDVVKQRCVGNKESLKDYLNRLIHDDMMKASEYICVKYFKE